MKGFLKAGKRTGCLIALILFVAHIKVPAQQNNTLFFMHSLPEANYLNPAVQKDCGIFIGLPFISSLHVNIANSGFAFGKYLVLYTDGTYGRRGNLHMNSFPAKDYFLTEIHSVLLAVGIRRNDFYYNFTITEKDNGMILYTPDLVSFTLRGSNEFEGQAISLKGTRVAFNHYREYAFGVSKKYSDRLTIGVKAKILFGKYNFTTGNSSFGLFVEPGTQDILFEVNGGYNSSFPYALQPEGPGVYRFRRTNNDPLLKQLLNRRNPGLAFDFGFIYKYNERWTLSGSLLDLGMIWYRSNVSNYTLDGQYLYNGPFGDGQVDNTYLWDVFDQLNQNMTETLTSRSYLYFLDPRLYLGAARQLNKRYDLNFLLYNRLLPGKLQTGATVSLLTRQDKALRTSVSWSYMNNSFVNLGFGVSYGKSPVQLYVVTDNILGFILPLSVKNVNLRFGINLNLSCREVFDINQCGCAWLKDAQEKKLRIQKFRHKNR